MLLVLLLLWLLPRVQPESPSLGGGATLGDTDRFGGWDPCT